MPDIQSPNTALTWPCLRLNRPTEILGYDFRGRGTRAEVFPEEELGLWVDVGADLPILVTPEYLVKSGRSITFRYGRVHIPRIEHFLLSGWFATGMVLRTEDGRLPYNGSASDFVTAIMGNVVREGDLKPYHLPLRGITSTEGTEAFVDLSATDTDTTLALDVRVKYSRRWGEGKEHRIDGSLTETVTPEFLHRIAYARSLGLPAWCEWVSMAASRWLEWPHHYHHVWKGWRPSASNLALHTRETLEHRCLDLLGTLLTAIPPGHYPVGKVASYKAGHRHDLDVAKQLFGLRKA